MNFTNYKQKVIDSLRWSQKYTETDMLYLAKGGFWWTVSRAGLFLISFLTMIAFAHWLPKEGYGTYQFVLAGLGFFTIFTLSGIDISLIKSTAQGKEGTLSLAVKEKIKFGTIGSLLSLILAGWYFIQGNNLLGVSFILVALFLPFRGTFPIFAAFWNGKKRFDIQAKYQVISAFLSALLIIPVIYFTNNVIIIIAVFLFAHTLFDWILYRKTEKQTINKEQDLNAILFGKHLTLMGGLKAIADYLDKIAIWHFLGAIPLAIYSFAKLPIQKVRELIPIAHLALPKLGENKIDESRKKGIISKFLRLFLITVPVAAILALIAPLIYQLFFPQYLESIVYFQALSIIIALSPFLLLEASLVSEMKKRALYAINIVTPLLKIILFLALIPYLGIWGIILAILASELLKGILSLYFFLRI